METTDGPPPASHPSPVLSPRAEPTSTSLRHILVGLFLGTVFLFALRLLGPSNLTDNDQERPASYVLDALRNGHWMVQTDWTGDITSKPPAYTWLAALVSWVLGGQSLFALYLPCALALFGSAALIAHASYRAIGSRVALWSGVFLLANPLTAKLVALARTDPLFTFSVTLTAMLTFRAWQRGRGWPWAWLAGAFATLTKGPLGLVLGFAGLAAWFWERRRGSPSPMGRGHVSGLILWCVVCLGWFWLAWRSAGDPLLKKMLGAELVQHALGEPGTLPGSGLVLAPAYYLSRFLPWSLLSLVGLGLAVRRPESNDTARQLQRFAAAWLILGLTIFGLAGHQRGDLIAPLMPAGALLAAIPVARWTATWKAKSLGLSAMALCLAIGLGSQYQHTHKNVDVFRETQGLSALAKHFTRSGESIALLRHADAPYALQFFLGTMQLTLPVDAAARHLRDSPRNSVAIAHRAALDRELGPDAARVRVIAAWPESAPHQFQIVALDPASARP